jgi:DNA modification methylase
MRLAPVEIIMTKLWESELLLPSDENYSTDPKIVDDLPTDDQIKDGDIFVIRNTESRYLTHLFHKYPGKFIPHIPRWALNRYIKRNTGAIVLDPFVGSGTTLVEAMLYGQKAYGVDVDPLARLISKVKTTCINESRLEALPSEIEGRLNTTRTGGYKPKISTLYHWFNSQAIEDLSIIYEVVKEYKTEPDVYDFLLICFSSIIRRASNADNQTMKTYVSHTNPKQPERAHPLFLKTVYTYVDRLIKFKLLIPNTEAAAEIVNANDSRGLDEIWKNENFPLVDIAITSPPYIKSVDYIYNQMAELFWIGERWGLENQEKQNEYKRAYIGHDRPSSSDSAILHNTGHPDIDEYITRVFERNKALAFVMWRYFSDVERHLNAMSVILKPGAHYIVVVGDSTLAGVSVPTHTLLKSCAERIGFKTCFQFAYEIRNKYMRFPRGGRGGVVAHDWVIDLAKIQ